MLRDAVHLTDMHVSVTWSWSVVDHQSRRVSVPLPWLRTREAAREGTVLADVELDRSRCAVLSKESGFAGGDFLGHARRKNWIMLSSFCGGDGLLAMFSSSSGPKCETKRVSERQRCKAYAQEIRLRTKTSCGDVVK